MNNSKNIYKSRIFLNKGYMYKKYDMYPSVKNIEAYYKITQGTGLLPKIYSIRDNYIKMEYICGTDGYVLYKSDADIISALCNLSNKLMINSENVQDFDDCLYTNRKIYFFDACIKKIKYLFEKKEICSTDKEKMCYEIEAMFYDTNLLWKKYFESETKYILHGDLHPGNMIFDNKIKIWRVIDPIVTIAPIEFEYVRFLENMTYSQGQGLNQKNLDIDIDDESLKVNIINYIVQLVSKNSMLNRENLMCALYIDSLLRTMETVVDSIDYRLSKNDLFKSIAYCRTVRSLQSSFIQ